MDFQKDNGTATKNAAAKETNQHAAANGTVKKENDAKPTATNGNGKAEAKDLKPATPKDEKPAQSPEPGKRQEANNDPKSEEQKPAEATPVKTGLTLDAKLKAVGELHRKSIQRLALIARIHTLEEFEVKLQEENDELEENPYRGCKLIIEDDKRRQFTTNTPNLIRMVSQFIFDACTAKLEEIEATINFPTA